MKIIEIIVDPTGATTVQTRGYAGSECQQASKFIERTLGEITSDIKTGEYFQATQSQQQEIQQ